MRIMHITEALGGGIFEVVSNLSAGLADQGHDVAIAYGVRGETPSPLRDAVDPRVELIPTAWTERTLRASLRASRELRPVVGDWRPDVIHLHSSFAGVVGAATLSGLAPTVYTPHGYSFTMSGSRLRRGAFRMVERRVARRVEIVGAVSDAEGHLAREVASAPRVSVVNNGIPELDPDSASVSSAKRRAGVVAMGRVVAQRRPEEAAVILADVADLAPVSWLGGANESSPGIEALTSAGVPVSGWLDREAALDRLARAKVYLHWTAWDGMPLSILEAMARDVVVIASDIPANRNVLGPRQVFSLGEDAAAAIRRVLLDDSYRRLLLREQRARRGQYGSTAMMLGWEDIYRSLADGRKPRAGGPAEPQQDDPPVISERFAIRRLSGTVKPSTMPLNRV
jgi:glycosyltransferase involved in cell wall biosynthesis